MSLHVPPPPLPRYIVSLPPAVQAQPLTGAGERLLSALDDSPLFAALHLPATPSNTDPLLRAALLTSRLKRTGLFAEVAIGRKHPVNVARTLLSLSHLSAHHAGWSLRPAEDDAVRAENPWLNPEPRQAPKGSIRQEFASVVTALTRSWPYESLIGDQERGWLQVEGALQTISSHGHFDVEGVLNIPSAPHGAIPFLTFADDAELAGHLRVRDQAVESEVARLAEVRIRPVDAPSNGNVGHARATSAPGPALFFVEGVTHVDQLRRLKRHTELSHVDDAADAPRASIWELLGVRPSIAPLVRA